MLAEHAHTLPLRGIMATPHLAAQCYGQQLKAAAAGQCRVALDCGSGVGRIAEQLLLQHFQEVGNPLDSPCLAYLLHAQEVVRV